MTSEEQTWPWFLLLRDINPEMVMAWLDIFDDYGPWSTGSNNILHQRGDAIISPANSYGYMDGGIDLAYRTHFGLGLQNRLQHYLEEKFGGMLPVGQAIIIPTMKEGIPHMIVAPTMDRPRDVSKTQNAYVAMKAALAAVAEYNQRAAESGTPAIYRILCPGMCTGIGMMNPFVSARQMRQAVDEVLESWNQ